MRIAKKKKSLKAKIKSGALLLAFIVASSAAAAEPQPIANVYITGNDRVPAKEIVSHITSIHTGEPFNEKNVQEDLDRILAMGVFDEVKARVVPTASGCIVFFNVVESPPVRSVKIDSPVTVSNVAIQEGDLVNSEAMKEQVNSINKELRSQGKLAAVSGVSYTPEGDIRITVKEKKVGSILFTGLKHTQTWLAEKLIRPLKIGDKPSQNDLQAAAKRLYDSGFFKDVSIRLEQGLKPDEVIVIFDIDEDYTGEWRLGGGYNTHNGVIASGGIKNRNIGGEGRSLDLTFSGNGKGSNYNVNYTDPYFKKTDDSFSLSAWKNHYVGLRDNTDYRESQSGGSIEYAKTITDNPRLQFIKGFRVESESTDKNGIHQESKLRILSVGMLFSSVDNKVDPSTGHTFVAKIDQGLRALGGTTSFTKLYSEFKKYHPVSEKGIIATRINFQSGTKNTPVTEQFSLGGDMAVRGVPEGDKKGTGGTSATIEYRYKVSDTVETAIFGEAGKTWGAETSDTAIGGGVGVRFKTAMGVLRFDFAKAKGSGWQTIFGFGRSF